MASKRTSTTTKKLKRHTPEQFVKKLRDAVPMLNAGQKRASVLQALEVRIELRPLQEPVGRHELCFGRIRSAPDIPRSSKT
ncbi:hypothetical protein Pla110_09460 [Polystyrenella longa]|uniref:Uncharacterized protein n=1 Tax=Polystyrenella longa TaxID=2528007 RepID=A0A518CJ54_9PLAN|nr:hypothetical protein Pla110_09460 [Polystyrenella longa]